MRWKKAELPDLATRLKWAFVVALVTALIVPVIAGHWTPLISVGLFLAFWVMASIVVNIKERVRHVRGGLFERLRAQGRAYWGMQLAHLGVAVFIVGVTVVNGYQVERDMRMNVGDTVQVGRYDIKFDGTQRIAGANYTGARGTSMSRATEMRSRRCIRKKRIYNVQKMPMTEAAIDTAYGAIFTCRSGSRSIRARSNPALERARVSQAAGDLDLGRMRADGIGRCVALSDRRYRLLARRERSAASVQASA